MLSARKRVGPLPTHRLVMRHLVNYSSSDHFSSDDSSSTLETSSDSPVDALSDSAPSRSSSDHSLPASPSGTRFGHRLCSLVEMWILLSFLGSSSLYTTGSIRSRILNGPMYRGLSFPRFPNRKISLRGDAFNITRLLT
ncbi:hypothetical protein Tco_0316411 [Tanacetum coccineum]